MGNITVSGADGVYFTAEGGALTITTSTNDATFVTDTEVEEKDEQDDTLDTAQEMRWEGVLGMEGVPTDDKRFLIPGGITEREMPLTLMAQFVTSDGHDGARVAGRIDRMWRMAMPLAGQGAVAIMGEGVFDTGEDGQEACRLVKDGMLTGVSLDLSVSDMVPVDSDSLQPVDPESVTPEDLMSGRLLAGMSGTVLGATLVPFPAFAGATVRVLGDDRVLVASAHTITLVETPSVLTASAAGLAPMLPPEQWFFMPETDGPCPITVTPEGQVYGHLADWNTCHIGIKGYCQTAPRSNTDYKHFHLGEIETAEGTRVAVGRLTVGDGGHADPSRPSLRAAIDHYDKTGMVGAFVRASNGKHGIWLSGAVRSDCPAEKIRDMMANPPSGDWREFNGNLELVAALAVPVPGFPVPRAEYALVASGNDDEYVSELAVTNMAPRMTRAELRKKQMLSNRARQAFKDYPAEERRKMAKNGQALPDGSFPIADCEDAADAIHSIGRAAPGKRSAAEAHIRKRVRALGCTGSIFENWK